MKTMEKILRDKLFEWNNASTYGFKFNWESPNDIDDSDLNSITSEGFLELINSEIVSTKTDWNDCNELLNTYKLPIPSGNILIQYIEWENCEDENYITFDDINIVKEVEVTVKDYCILSEDELLNLA